ncbi:hypothetical protein K070079E91_23470 [Eisenbergiella porci]
MHSLHDMKAEYTDPGMLRFFSERPPKAAFSFAAIPVSCIRTAAQALKRKRKTVKEVNGQEETV